MVFTLTRQLGRGQLADRAAKYDDLTAEAQRVSMTTLAAHQRATFGRASSKHGHKKYLRGRQETCSSGSEKQQHNCALPASSDSKDAIDVGLRISGIAQVGKSHGTFNQGHMRPKSAPLRPGLCRSRSAFDGLGVSGFAPLQSFSASRNHSIYDLAYQGKERLANQNYRFVKKPGSSSETSSRQSIARLGSVRISTAMSSKSGVHCIPTSNCASLSQLCLDITLPAAGEVLGKPGPTARAKSAIGSRTNVPMRSYRDKYRRLAADRRERESSARRLFWPRTSVRTMPRGRAWGLLMGPVDKKDGKKPKDPPSKEGTSNQKRSDDGSSSDGASDVSSGSSEDENEYPKDMRNDQEAPQAEKPDKLQLPDSLAPSEKRKSRRQTKAKGTKGKVTKGLTPKTSAGARQACVLRTKLTKLVKKSSIAHVAGRLVRKVRWLREQDDRVTKSSEPMIHYFTHNPPSPTAQRPCWMPDYEVTTAECRTALQAKPHRTHHDLGTIYEWLFNHLSKDCWMYRAFQGFGYELCAKTRHVKKHASAEVICAGQNAIHVYIVLTGSVSVWKFKSVMGAAATRAGYGEPVAQDLVAGEVFGIGSLLEASGVSGSHDVSVLANVDTEFIVLHRDFFRTIMKAKYDEEIVRMAAALTDFQFFKDLGPRNPLQEPVKTSNIPRKLTQSPSRLSIMRMELESPSNKANAFEEECEERQSIVETVEQSFYKRGSVVVRAGAPFTHLYFVVSGHCEVVQRESVDSHDFQMAEANEKFGEEMPSWKFATVAILGRGALLTAPVPINPLLLPRAEKPPKKPIKYSGSQTQKQRPRTAHALLKSSQSVPKLTKPGSDRGLSNTHARHQGALNAAHAELLRTRPPVYSHTVRCVTDCVLLKFPRVEVEERLCAQSLGMLKSLGQSILDSWNQRVGMLRSKTFRSRDELAPPSEREYAFHPMTQRRTEENKAQVVRELFQVVKFGQSGPQNPKSSPTRPKSALQASPRATATKPSTEVQRRPASAMNFGTRPQSTTAVPQTPAAGGTFVRRGGVERFRGVLYKSKSNPTLRVSKKPRPHTATGSVPLRTCVASLARSYSQPNFYTGGPMSAYTLPTPAELAFNNTLASVPLATSLDNPQLSRDLELTRGGASSSPPVLRAQPRQFLWESECVRGTLPLDFSLALRNSKNKKGFSFSRPSSSLSLKADLFPLREPKPNCSPEQSLTSSASTGRLPSLRPIKSAYRKSQQIKVKRSRVASKHTPSCNRTVAPTLNPLTSPKFPHSRPLMSSMSVRSLCTGQNVYQSSAYTAKGMRTCSIASIAKRVSTLHERTFKNSRSESIGLWRGIEDSKTSHGEVFDADARRFSTKHFPRRKSLSRRGSHRPTSLVSEAQSLAEDASLGDPNIFQLLAEEVNSVRSQHLARRASANSASVSAHVEEDRHWTHSEPFRRQSLRRSQKFRANSSTPPSSTQML